jgi:PadR family transcriptional regulator, regulatory protein PadR
LPRERRVNGSNSHAIAAKKKRNEQNLVRYARARHGRLPANGPESHDALRERAAFASWRRRNIPVCSRKESESTVSNEKPKRANVAPPGNTPGNAFGIGGRPRIWLVPVVLLSLRVRNSHGYELMERASAFGFGATNTGTMYRALRRMEKDGVVESSWETSRGDPARRMYAITDAGEAHLGFWAKSLEHHQHAIDDFFGLYAGKPPPTNEN